MHVVTLLESGRSIVTKMTTDASNYRHRRADLERNCS